MIERLFIEYPTFILVNKNCTNIKIDISSYKPT